MEIEKRIIPNLFVIGYPKCGTSALYEYFKKHPNIFVNSMVKEPSFFNEDPNFKSKYGIDLHKKQYLKLYKTNEKFMYYADLTTTYSLDLKAIKNIIKFNKEAKFILSFREPSSFLISFHIQRLKLKEKETKLMKILSKEGFFITNSNIKKTNFNYSDLVKYKQMLENILKIVPKENLHIYFYEDFKENNQRELNKIFDFLEVDKVKMKKDVVNVRTISRIKDLHTNKYYIYLSKFARKYIPTSINRFVYRNILCTQKNSLKTISSKDILKIKTRLKPQVKEFQDFLNKSYFVSKRVDLIKKWKYKEL